MAGAVVAVSLPAEDDIDGEDPCGCSEPNVAWQWTCVFVIKACYAAFLLLVLVPQLSPGFGGRRRTWRERDALGGTAAFHVLYMLLWVSYLRAACTDPGRIPQHDVLWQNERRLIIDPKIEARVEAIYRNQGWEPTPLEIEMLRQIRVLERKKRNGQLRYCRDCLRYKPDRSHHCRQCQECTLRMDHHCPWLNNCVGYYNYKFFFLAVFYGVVNAAFIFFATLPTAIRSLVDGPKTIEAFWGVEIPTILLMCSTLALSLTIGIFWGFHVYLACNNMTTIEYREKANSRDAAVRHRFRVAHLKFDRGWYANTCEVLGPPWMWLIPIRPSGDGLFLGNRLAVLSAAHAEAKAWPSVVPTFVEVDDKDRPNGASEGPGSARPSLDRDSPPVGQS